MEPIVVDRPISGILSVPQGVSSITIQAWGGGGAGGSAYGGDATLASNQARAGGGAGGSYAGKTLMVQPGDEISYSLGAGGAGAPEGFTHLTAGTSGGVSSVQINGTTVASAVGGPGGINISIANASVNGGGGTAALSGNTGDTIFYGGSGCAGSGLASAFFGAGSGSGGGSAGATGNGGNAPSPTTAGSAGSGGGAVGGRGINNTGPGLPGGAPGAGGSGAIVRDAWWSHRTGGKGGDGKIIFSFNTIRYTLTPTAVNGTITIDPSTGPYISGAEVPVTATPNLGFAFANWSGDLTGSVNPTTITMDGNKSVTANFVATSTYTLTTAGANGSVTLSPPGGIYNQGTVVTVTATPDIGYAFANWTGDLTGAVDERTITMDGNKSVTANFLQNAELTALTGWVSGTSNPTVSGNNRLMTVMVMGEHVADFSATGVTYGGQTMTKRSERLFSVTGNRTYAALFTLGEVGVNAATSGNIAVNWSIIPSAGSAVYSVLLAGVDQANPVSAVANQALNGTTISTPTSLFAGTGDLVVMGGATENNTTLTFNNGFTQQFETNATWGDATGGLKVGVGANETPSFTQSGTGRMVLCAMVVKRAVPTFSLATTASNGTVTLNPPGGIYTEGTVVTVTAEPESDFTFSNWSGDLTGSVNPTSVTMTGNLSVTANFTLPTYTLTTAGTNGTVTLNPPGGIYDVGTVVTVTAAPNSGFVFSNWSGGLAGSANPTSVTMNGDLNVTANFAPGGPKTWDGGGANSNWSTVDNWSNNSAPSGPTAISYTFAGNTQNNSNNDLSGLVASDFNFTNNGSVGNTNPFVLSGNTMTVQNISTTASSSVIADTINFNISTAATGVYDINTSHHLTINGNISETIASGLTKNGNGILTLSGNNTYTGATLLQAGTISLSSIADGGSGSNIGSGNSMRIGNSGVTATLNYTGNGSTTTRTVQIGNGANTGGAIILATGANGGTGLKFTAPTFNPRDTDSTNNARVLTLSGPNTDDNTISGIIQNAKTSGVLNLVKEGNGKWILSGANTYTGNTTVSGGTLQLSGSGKLGGAGGSYAGTLAIASGATFRYEAAGNQSFSGVVGTGGGNLSMAGSGDLILSNAANAYGALNISAGRVFIANTGALPTAATVALAGGSLNFNAAGTYNRAIAVSSVSNIAARQLTSLSNVTLPSSGSVTFNNDNDPTVGLTITNNQNLSGTLSIQVGGGNATVGTTTLSGNISGAGGAITKIGTGTLALTGNNTYTGTTTVSAGRLILGNNTAGNNGIISDSSNISVGGGSPGNTAVLQFNRADNTIYAGNITGTLASLAFVDSIGNGNLTLSGNLGTSAIYIKKFTNSGSGAVNLTGTNYAGDTTDLFGTDRSAINVTGGTTTKANGVFIGNNGTGTMSTMNISSSGQFIVANNTSIRVGAGGYDGSATNGASELTITGNALFDTATTTGIFQLGSSTAANTVGTGTINLNGGTLSTNRSISGGSVANSTFNFNGGTFKATGTTATISLNATLGRVNVRNGGAKIDTNGNNISIAQALLRSNIGGDLATDGGLTKIGTGTLTLSGANAYTGATTISAGTLAMGASNVLPATAVSIGSATLNAATFTDTVGTLDVTGSATINLGVGAALTFSDSRAIDWSGGTLTITGTFVSGSSLRIGTSSSGLTGTQLSQISKPGGGAVTINESGFLVALPATSYTSWASTNASSTTSTQDQDNDGVLNAVEYVLGGNVLTNDLSKLPVISSSGGNVLFTFKRTQTSINATTALRIQVGTTLHTWPDSYTVGADTVTSSAGVEVLKGVPAGFDTITLSVPKASASQKFIRLNVNITP